MSFSGLQKAVSGVSGVAGSAASLLDTVSSLADGSWLSELLPASWRGITFLIRSEEHSTGRRTAPHRYAYRDDVWSEDMGRAERTHDFSAFLIGDTCHAQAKALISASEQEGSGPLQHPWLGLRTVTLAEPIRTSTRMELGRVVEVRFRFIETVDPGYPTSAASTQAASAATSIASFISQAASFANKIAGYVSLGSAIVNAGVRTVESFTETAGALVHDAGLVASAVAGLQPPDGSYYGRYASGARGTVLAGVTTPAQAIASVVTAQALVALAETACLTAAASPGLSTNPLPTAVKSLTEAIRTACNDPADAVRLLTSLSGFDPQTVTTTAPIGIAISVLQSSIAALCRQAVLYSIALALADYQPTSSNDAYRVRGIAIALFDAEALIAADAGNGAEYLSLKAQKAAVVADLDARAAQLPALITIETAAPMPSLVEAYRLYGDASRADDLTSRSGAVASMFLPTSFEALSS